ncbi:MAG: cytochrome P450 [Xenococcaceae cyanobacterium]
MLSDVKPPTYNLFSPEALNNPYPLYQQMRTEDPVYYCESLGYWFLTRYDDVEAALGDERLSADRRSLFVQQLGDLDVELIQNFLRLIGNMMIEQDPPKHTRFRKLANQGFTTQALESWRSIIQDTTDALLDLVCDSGAMDIVADLSVPLPALIIAEIFGVPEENRDDLIQWALDIGTFWGAPGGQDIETLARKADVGAEQFTALMSQLIEARRRQPGTDMISLLTVAYSEQGFDLDQLPSLCILILNAGHLTTTDLIPNAVNALLRHPYQLQLLKNSPDLMCPAVEEMLRFDTPAPFVFRIAKQDLTIGGQDIPAGSVLALGLGAANHDPEKFTHPEQFDILRSPNKHLSFGPGVHFCLGAVLARMELTICLNTLLSRMPNLCFDGDQPAIPRHTSLVFKGFDSLPVRF